MSRAATTLLAFMTSAIALIACLVGLATPAGAAGCYGDSCTGRDPESSRCSSDARTLDWTSGSARGKGVMIELRYSPSCYAAWTRYQSPMGGIADVSIRGNVNSFTEHTSGVPGDYDWTPMVSFRQWVKSCIVFYHNENGWTTNCTRTF